MIAKSLCKRILALAFAFCLIVSGLGININSLKVYAEGQEENVLYVGGATADDANSGQTVDNAVATLAQAYQLIPDNNMKTYIVICGPVNVKTDNVVVISGEYYNLKPHDGEVIITSLYENVDYRETADAGLDMSGGYWCLMGDTTFENINITSKAPAIYSHYFDLNLGEGITSEDENGVFADTVNLGINSSIYTLVTADVTDVAFTMKSGTIGTLYGGGVGRQHTTKNIGKDYSIKINVEGGTIETLYGSGYGRVMVHHKNITINMKSGSVGILYGAHGQANIHGDVYINMSGGTIRKLYGTGYSAETDYTPGFVENGKIEITKSGGRITQVFKAKTDAAANVNNTVLHYQDVENGEMDKAEGFSVLKLSGSNLTIPEGHETYWSSIKQIWATDDSQLTFAMKPTSAVEVLLTKSGTEWKTDEALIVAPVDTENVFKVTDPMDYELKYDNTAVASWTLGKGQLSIGEPGTPGEALDLDLGLPSGEFTPIKADANAYEVFQQKVEDLGTFGTAKTAVNVIQPAKVQGEVELHVSPGGNDDTGNGSIDAPFYTIAKALSYVENLNNLGVQGIVIYLHGGTYVASETISLNTTHSGKNGIPVIISAYNNEKVVITGGTDIPGTSFTKVTEEAILNRLQASVRERIMVVDLKSLNISEFGSIATGRFGGPNYLVNMNGETLTLARYPDATSLPLGEVMDPGPEFNSSSTGVEYKMQDSRPKLWYNDGNIWRYGNLGGEWYKMHNRVAEIRTGSNSIKLEGGDTRLPVSEEKRTHYYYNILEELNVPGEYYIDVATKKLYLYPIGDMSSATVTYTAVSDYLIKLTGTENVVLNGLTIENGSGYGIYIEEGKNTLIQNCVIRNVEYGLKIDGKNCGVIYSEICDIGERPINIGKSIATYDYYNVEHNFVQNCHIYNTGIIGVSNTPIFVDGVQNVISHNLIQGTCAVSIYLNYTSECIVEYNEIVGGPNGTYDYGSIYCGGNASAGNHIRYNYIHDTARHSNEANPMSIYLDEGTRGYFVYGNIMVNVQNGVFMHFGSDNVIVDNIVMSDREGRYATPIFCNEKMAEFTIADRWARSAVWEEKYGVWAAMNEADRATFKQRYPSHAELWENVEAAIAAAGSTDTGKGLFTAEGNYAENNILVYFDGIDFEGRDHVIGINAILTEDPFADAENHNFALKDGVNLGFDYQAVDMELIGIIGRDKEGIDTFTQYAPSNGFNEVDPYNVLLKWTLAGGADTYHITIATNAELSENKREFTSEDNYFFFGRDDYFDFGKTYYWKVVANTTAESLIDTPVSSAVFSFTTMTEEKYYEYNKADLDELNEAIAAAESFLAGMKEISEGGLYNDGSKAKLQAVIDEAKGVLAVGERQNQVVVNTAVEKLENSVTEAKINRKIQYITFEKIDSEEWEDVANWRVSDAVVGEELQLTIPSGKRAESVYSEGLGIRDILCFKYKLDTLSGWNGFALAQVTRSKFITEGTDGYFICIKPAVVELHKYQNGSKVVQIDVPIDENVFAGGEYYDIEVGAINNADGTVGIHFKINNTVIFSPETHLDTETDESLPGSPILHATGFGVVVNPSNGTAYLVKADLTEEIKVAINNVGAASSGATITPPEGGWVEGTNTFTVSSGDAVACVVAVKNADGTYSRVTATATETEGSYSYTVEGVTAETEIAVAVAGDANGDGKVTNADITRLRAAYAGKITLDSLQELVADVNGSDSITNADITKLRAAYAGKIELNW